MNPRHSDYEPLALPPELSRCGLPYQLYRSGNGLDRPHIPPMRGGTGDGVRAPMRNRTADLLLTMETLCLLSYRGASMPREGRHQRTKIHTGRQTGPIPRRSAVMSLIVSVMSLVAALRLPPEIPAGTSFVLLALFLGLGTGGGFAA